MHQVSLYFMLCRSPTQCLQSLGFDDRFYHVLKGFSLVFVNSFYSFSKRFFTSMPKTMFCQ